MRSTACLWGCSVFKRRESQEDVEEDPWGLDSGLASHSCILTTFLSFLLCSELKPLPYFSSFHTPPHPQMEWLPSAPSWRRSSVKRTWSSGWPGEEFKKTSPLPNWSPRPIESLRSLWMFRLRGRLGGVLSDSVHSPLFEGVWARFDGAFFKLSLTALMALDEKGIYFLRCRAQGFYKKELY